MPQNAPTEPRHLAIIMDGNGRWAKARGLPREVGHERGVEALRRTVDACQKTSLSTLTVFSFSTENWKRPASEISSLFSLLRLYVKQDLSRLKAEGVRIRVIGRRSGLPEDVLSIIDLAESETRANVAFTLNIAFNYGSQDEIADACRKVAERCASGDLLPENITRDDIEQELWFADSPPVDLLVRTSGEYRLSNFMLWQLAYSELVFVDTLWPDFKEPDLLSAIDVYRNRERRFGGLKSAGLAT